MNQILPVVEFRKLLRINGREFMYLMWIIFLCLSVLIYVAGGRLSYYGDVLGEKWGIERSFIGLILLSTVTSLPELGTSLFSIFLVDSPDLALGNVLGSNLFNIFIIPILALLYREAFLNRSHPRHASTGNLVLLIYAILGLALTLHISGWHVPSFFHVSPFSLLIVVVATGGLYLIYQNRGTDLNDTEAGLDEVKLYPDLNPRRATIVFALSAFLVVLAGAGLAIVGKFLSVHTGLGDSFFGTLFFAFVTSLPEIIVSWMALKQLDAVNLALGNIMGSCLFNLAIIVFFDLATGGGAIFTLTGPAHLISVFLGIAMIALASGAILERQNRPAQRAFPLEMVMISIVYLAGIYLLYLVR